MPHRFSRFPVHDDLSAPEASAPILKGAMASAGRLPNLLGVMAGSPTALRGYTRLRAELRHGVLRAATLERIALAVAAHFDSEPGLALHRMTAREAGLGVDEIALAREWDAYDEREAALLRWLRPLVAEHAQPPAHLHEGAREQGWSDEEMLEAIAIAATESFTALVTLGGDVPIDGSIEAARQLRAA